MESKKTAGGLLRHTCRVTFYLWLATSARMRASQPWIWLVANVFTEMGLSSARPVKTFGAALRRNCKLKAIELLIDCQWMQRETLVSPLHNVRGSTRIFHTICNNEPTLLTGFGMPLGPNERNAGSTLGCLEQEGAPGCSCNASALPRSLWALTSS